jgi:predicted metalloprotease with PDZ domain
VTGAAEYIRIVAAVSIAAGTSPVTAAVAQQSPAAATYQVQLIGPAASRFAVRATLPSTGDRLDMAKSRPGDIPELAEAGWPALVKHLAVTDSGGHAVAVLDDGAGGWRLERSVTGPLLVRYEVDLAPLAAREWPAPREAAFADPRDLMVIGRSLFITTPAQQGSAVRFMLPGGWQVAAPWPSVPGVRWGSAVASTSDLTENLVAFTHGAPDVMTAGGFSLKVVGLGRWPPVRGEVRQALGTAIRRLVAIIGAADRTDYLVVLLPQGERGGESFRASFAFTYDSTPTRANRSDWARTIAHEVFHYWNGWRLRGADYQASQWFQEGFTDYIASLALVSGGLTAADDFYAQIAGYVRDSRRLTTPLDAPGSHKGPPLYGAGALVAFIWDIRIREATNGARGVGDLLRELLTSTGNGERPYAWADIEAALQRLAPGDWAGFQARYIHGSEPLPLEEAFAKAGLRVTDGPDGAVRIDPDPAAGEQAKALREVVLRGISL